jgi:replication initiation and membrane attachment protein
VNEMAQHWQELIPIDRYLVTSNGLLHEYDRKVLTFLYQPLIGSTCLSLYMTLWAELEENIDEFVKCQFKGNIRSKAEP